MYTPAHFQVKDRNVVLDFIRTNSFGILVSENNNRLLATHIPLELSDDGTKLSAHISRANPQWKDLRTDIDVLAIFSGPHTYISSSWYDHENVPTWNYMAAHVYGKLEIIEGDRLHQSIKKLVDKYEAHSAKPVSVEKMTPSYFEKEIRGLVGFEIHISSIEASYKLSQNRDAKNYQNIIQELEKRNDHESSAVAQAMKQFDPRTKSK